MGEGVVWAVSQALELDLNNFKDLIAMLTFMEENSELQPWGQWGWKENLKTQFILNVEILRLYLFLVVKLSELDKNCNTKSDFCVCLFKSRSVHVLAQKLSSHVFYQVVFCSAEVYIQTIDLLCCLFFF